MENSKDNITSIIIFILGLVSLFSFPPLGFVVWIWAKKEEKQSGKDTFLFAGKLCGIISSILCIIGLVIGLLWGLFILLIQFKILTNF